MRNFSGQYFPVFGLNRETRSISPYSVRMRENNVLILQIFLNFRRKHLNIVRQWLSPFLMMAKKIINPKRRPNPS